jgi:hypothetical protein
MRLDVHAFSVSKHLLTMQPLYPDWRQSWHETVYNQSYLYCEVEHLTLLYGESNVQAPGCETC